MGLLNRFFCSHHWDKVSEITSKSIFESLEKYEVGNIPTWRAAEYAAKKHVIILKCDICGATKKIETAIPG